MFWTVLPYVDAGGQQLFLKGIDWDAYQPKVICEMTQAYAQLQASYDHTATQRFHYPRQSCPPRCTSGMGACSSARRT